MEKKRQKVLDVVSLQKYFPIQKGILRKTIGHVKAVDDVSFSVYKGETLGLVGESGCGKTTTARLALRALEPTRGSITLNSRVYGEVDLASLNRKDLRQVRREVQMIFQDPYSSLNPRMPVLDIVAEPLLAHGARRKDCEEKVAVLLEKVGLKAAHMRRYPHAFSGGQRQRIGIARSLIVEPSLVVADEPVSALDVSVQAQILNLLLDLQKEMGLTFLFIAHDLSVIRHICDRVAVMYLGKIVELATTDTLFQTPKHPYTSMLMRAVPIADPFVPWVLEGKPDRPLVEAKQNACRFSSRCVYAKRICQEQEPKLTPLTGNHFVSCHFANELSLKGVS